MNTNSPIVQVHEREISGFASQYGVTTPQVGEATVSEITVPVYLAYEDHSSAIAAASGLQSGKGGLGEVALAFDRPGSVRIAWLGNRRKTFYHTVTPENSSESGLPVSLQQVYARMSGNQFYAKTDGLYSAMHSLPSVQYEYVDVKEVEATKVRIPKSVRPIVCGDKSPDAPSNGATIYPPGKYIVLFGFATMRCNTMERGQIARATTPITNPDDAGWVFWMKVIVKVVIYAIEVAAAVGQPMPDDSTAPVWQARSNLEGGAVTLDMPAIQDRIRQLVTMARSVKRLDKTSKSLPKRKVRKLLSN